MRRVAPSVVFVHGLAGDRSHWAAQLEFCRRDFPAAAVDLPGHGEAGLSPDGDYSVEGFAAALAAQIDRLGFGRSVLVGHSLGASVIGAYAGSCPDRVAGLLLVDPTGDLTRLPREQVEAYLRALDGPGYDDFIRNWYLRLLRGATEEVRSRVLDSLRATPREVIVPALRAASGYDPLPAFERCPAPRLSVIHPALNDGPESLQRVVPGLPARALAGASHWLMMDRPEAFNRILGEFLRGP